MKNGKLGFPQLKLEGELYHFCSLRCPVAGTLDIEDVGGLAFFSFLLETEEFSWQQ